MYPMKEKRMLTHEDIQNIEMRRRELLRQAKLERLAAEARRDTPAMQRRLLVLLSDLMIAGGNKLQDLADPQRTSRLGAHPDWIAEQYR
jgi:hypothetical protein